MTAIGLNKVMLVGTADRVELRGNGRVLSFNVEVLERYVNTDGELKESKSWHRCVLFGRSVEAIHAELRDGTPVVVEGRLQNSSYDKDGVKQYKTEIVCSSVTPFPSQTSLGTANEPDGSDLPF